MVGYSDASQIDNLKHKPFWIFHDNIDEWNQFKDSRTIFKLIKESKADVTFIEYVGANQEALFLNTFNKPELISWMFSKSK